MQHVATWREGDEKWNYHKDAFAHIATHKVSLDPYRLESKRILACIKDMLPEPPIQRVEKASVDEVFLDLSAQIHSILIERYPEIGGPAPYDDPTELLPRPPTTALDWNSDALVDLDNTETEHDDPDWDDIAMLIGSEIVRSVRASIRERLKYTCSAGIARNKMLAKLGSAHKKPNQQTIVRNRAVQNFLAKYKFTKIRNLGGKLGEDVVLKFGTDQVNDLLAFPLEQLRSKLGDETGSWVFEMIRGEDSSEVNFRTQIKSMLSAKSFRPNINTVEQAVKWLRIFASDIFSRLVEEGVLENKRRPRTINLHHRQGAQMRSRQAPIPTGRSIDDIFLFDISKNLLGQIVLDGRAWPCSNLQLSVGGFEDGPIGNQGIGSFLIRGEEAKAMMSNARDYERDEPEGHHAEKRRKSETGALQRFFAKKQSSYGKHNQLGVLREGRAIDENGSSLPFAGNLVDQEESGNHKGTSIPFLATEVKRLRETLEDNPATVVQDEGAAIQSSAQVYVCDLCSKSMSSDKRDEHEDWHFAKDMQAQERIKFAPTSPQSTLPEESASRHDNNRPSTFLTKVGRKRLREGQGRKTTEKGQCRLVFRS